MTTPLDMFRRIESLNIKQVATDALEDTASVIAEKNREQLEEGFDSNRENLLPYRSKVYAGMKNQMNPKPGYGNPDLKLTGAFYRGIRAEVNDDGEVHTYSTDSKDGKLVMKYGTDIYGLGIIKGQEYINDHLSPAFNKAIHAKLNL